MNCPHCGKHVPKIHQATTRAEAVAMLRAGETPEIVARKVAASISTVRRWWRTENRKGGGFCIG